MNWLFEDYIRRLFANAQIRKGRALSFAELAAIAQPKEQTPQFNIWFMDGLRRGLFFRGYVWECPRCLSLEWYPPGELGEGVVCRACGAIFQPPPQADLTYKPNALLTNALKNGALTQLLFLHQLRSVSEQMLWGGGYKLRGEGEEIEFDLVTLLGDVLTLVECKDHFTDPAAVRAQLERVLGFAYRLKAEAVLFVTLNPDPPADLVDWFNGPDEQVLRRVMGRGALLGARSYWA
jgi:hypothetical protein